MFSPELNRLIEASLTDGVLTEQERAVIKKRALLEGIDPDEVDVILESKLQDLQQKAQEAVAKVRKCPACGAIISSMQTICPQCGSEITNVSASKSMEKLSDMINDVTASEMDSNKRYERIATIIKSFPVPTSKGDILDFLFIASTNATKKSYSSYPSLLLVIGIGFLAALVLGFLFGVVMGPFGFIIGIAVSVFVCVKLWNSDSFINKRAPYENHNKMAPVWKSKCEQVIAKAKFSLHNDAEAMSYINQIEQQIKK